MSVASNFVLYHCRGQLWAHLPFKLSHWHERNCILDYYVWKAVLLLTEMVIVAFRCASNGRANDHVCLIKAFILYDYYKLVHEELCFYLLN